MKKIITLLLFTLFITGCEASYELEINDNKLKETIRFDNPTDINQRKEIQDFLNQDGYVFTNDETLTQKYRITKLQDEYKLNYEYNENEFINVALLNNCFDSFQYNATDKFIAIKAKGKFACLYNVPNLKVKIKTDYEVSKENADQKEDGYYIWNINNMTKNNMDIEFTVLKNTITKSPKKGNFIVNFLITVLLIGVLCFGGFLIKFALKKIDNF